MSCIVVIFPKALWKMTVEGREGYISHACRYASVHSPLREDDSKLLLGVELSDGSVSET